MTFLLVFILGFSIAAVGIIAPGMLNMTIAKISIDENKNEALKFALGSVIIVFFQSFIGVFFAKLLEQNPMVSTTLKRFGVVIFLLLTVFFIFKGINQKKQKIDVKLEKKKNRFWYGVALSSLNMFAIPYYAFVSLTLATSDLFAFQLPQELVFSMAAALGTYTIFYLYAVLFKKVEHKVAFLINNINFFIAAVTGLVAISTLYKMFV